MSGLGFRNEHFYIPALFYADDGLILSNDRREMEIMMQQIRELVDECGLNISQLKSECLIINGRKDEVVEEVDNIKVVTSIKYLGIIVTNKRNYFKKHMERNVNIARKMSNMAFSIIARSCDKLVIGKTYWKNIVLPCILVGSAVVDWLKSDLDTLQRIEYSVWRQVLGAPRYVALETLRGEVGCSTFEERNIKSKFSYINYVKNDGAALVQKVLETRMEDERDPWTKTVHTCLKKLNLTLSRVIHMNKEEIKKEIYK